MEDINDNQDVELEYAIKFFNQKILPGPGHWSVGILILKYKFIKILKFLVLYLEDSTTNAGKDIQLESIHFFLYFKE